MDSYNLNLAPDEVVIMREARVDDGLNSTYDDELILTNRNLIHAYFVKTGLFSREERINKYTLIGIRTAGGKPNILVEKDGMGKTRLEVFFAVGEKHFYFQNFLAPGKWAKAIEKAHKAAIKDEFKNQTKGSFVQSMSSSVQGIIGNVKLKRTSSNTDMKCPHCGAALVGVKGEVVECDYCRESVTIK